ncbi:MAG: DUF5069 domain-containing protein [Candidatus Baltobacteraceae bacterium]
MQPLDLTKQAPRAPREQLGGLVMLPRTIDKLRAGLPGGNIGEYQISPGLSQWFLDELKLTEERLREVVASARDDDEVVTWIHTHTDPSTYAEANKRLSQRPIDDPADPAGGERRRKRYPVAADHPEMTTIFQMIEADDRDSFPSDLV